MHELNHLKFSVTSFKDQFWLQIYGRCEQVGYGLLEGKIGSVQAENNLFIGT